MVSLRLSKYCFRFPPFEKARQIADRLLDNSFGSSCVHGCPASIVSPFPNHQAIVTLRTFPLTSSPPLCFLFLFAAAAVLLHAVSDVKLKEEEEFHRSSPSPSSRYARRTNSDCIVTTIHVRDRVVGGGGALSSGEVPLGGEREEEDAIFRSLGRGRREAYGGGPYPAATGEALC